MPTIVHDRSMNDAEALMWRLEQDPQLSSNVANVTLLDRAPDMDLLRARLARAVLVIPRLRQVVRAPLGGLGPPTFADDGDLDLDRHVRRIALPKPGSQRQLYDLAALIAADPFDRNLPLWQLVVVEGLRGGHAALIQKVHHTITDGEGGIELAAQFLDLERDALGPPPLSDEEIADGTASDDGAGAPDPDAVDAVRDLLGNVARIPIGVAREVGALLADPAGISDAASAAGTAVRGLAEQLGDTTRAKSPLWTRRSSRRRIEVATAPFDETRDAARRLGGTLNTAFVTLAADAASRYHHTLGHPTPELRASMAVSTRGEGSGANAFSLVRLSVPTGEMALADRFHAVAAAIDDAREQADAGALEAMAAVSALLPTPLVTRLARQQSGTIDFATSNVRGAPMPLYVAGARLLHNYAVGPLIGTAFNLTLLSYAGNLDMGLHIDPAAVEQPELLVGSLRAAIDDLVAPS